MNHAHSRYQDREYSAEDLAQFDTADAVGAETSWFMQDGRAIGRDAALVTGVMREHSIMPGLNAVLMNGKVLGEFLTKTEIPSGLMIFVGFKANGHTDYGNVSLPHQTLPNVLYLYSAIAIPVEQRAFIGPCQTIAIHFADDQFRQMLTEHCLDQAEKDRILDGLNISGPCHYWRAGADVMEQLHSLIYTELTGIHLSLFVNQTVIGIMRALLGHIAQTAGEAGSAGKLQLQASDITRIEKAAAYIEANMDAKLTVEAIARHVGASGQFLKLNFPLVHGDSVAYYVLKTRMNRARIMLASGGMTIKQVAARVGYGSQASFTTAFRKYHSMTPREAFKACF